MKDKFNHIERRGLPGGPNEQFTYVTNVFSTDGYRYDSPDVNNIYNVIPSGNISMREKNGEPLKKGPILGIDNLGNKQLMQPGFDYQFPGDQVFEKPFRQKGGIVPTFKEGGYIAEKTNDIDSPTAPCPPGKIYDPIIMGCVDETVYISNRVVQKDSINVDDALRENKRYYKGYKFMQDWMNSPMYDKMLKEGARSPESYQYMKKMRQQQLQSTPPLQILPQPKDLPNTGGYSLDATGQIVILPTGFHTLGTHSHEVSHSSDRPVSGKKSRLIPQRDIDYINKSKAKTFGDSREYYNNKNQYDKDFKDFPEYRKQVDDNFREFSSDYVGESTEVRARLNAIRQLSKESGLYDPFTQGVSPDLYYKKLKNHEFEKGDKSDFDPMKQLQNTFSDEEIIWLLNNMSKIEDNRPDLDMADEGGLLMAQIGKETKKNTPIKKKFEQRLNNPTLSLKNEDGTYSTHEMISFESDGKYYAAPRIIERNGKLERLSKDDAYNYAMQNKEYKEFKTEKEAQAYAQGNYKMGTPLQEKGQLHTYDLDEHVVRAIKLPNVDEDDANWQKQQLKKLKAETQKNKESFDRFSNNFQIGTDLASFVPPLAPYAYAVSVPFTLNDMYSDIVKGDYEQLGKDAIGLIPSFKVAPRVGLKGNYVPKTNKYRTNIINGAFNTANLSVDLDKKALGGLLMAQKGKYIPPNFSDFDYGQTASESTSRTYNSRELNRPVSTATPSVSKQQVVESVQEAQRLRKIQEDERRARIADSEAAKKTPYTLQNFPEVFARETQAIGDKLQSAYIPDAINPAVWLGDFASGLGRVPLNIQQGNYGQAALNIGMPLAIGAFAGLGAKTTGQFANNLVNPVAGFSSGNFASNVSNKIDAAIIHKPKEILSGMSSGVRDIVKYKRPFFETFPITKAQKEHISNLQNVAFEEGNKFAEDWFIKDRTDIFKDIYKNQKVIRPEVEKRILDLYGTENLPKNFLHDPSSVFDVDKLLITKNAKGINSINNKSNIDYLNQKRSSVGGINADDQSITFRNSGWYYETPQRIKDVAIHEAGHSAQKIGGRFESNRNPGWYYEIPPWGQETTKYSPEMKYYTSNPNTEIGREFGKAMKEPGKKYRSVWHSSPNELHSELMAARGRAYDNLVKKQGYTSEEAITKLQDLTDSNIDWLNKAYNLDRFFKPTTSIETKRKLIRALPAITGAIGAGALQEKSEYKTGGDTNQPKYQTGNEIAFNIYKKYINGDYIGTLEEGKAKKTYDRLNRIYYKDAKSSGMSVPNYIMTNVVTLQ